MRVLALEPYFGGSHKAFLDGWQDGSEHDWTLLTLTPYKWKWRMRHGALTLAQEATRRAEAGEHWDVIFASSMLALAEFRGLAPPEVARLPSVVYFHENQLTYPVRVEKERDLHFAMTQLTTALSADAVWFNSAFHRDEFLGALALFLKRMPDHQPTRAVASIRARSKVLPQGISPASHRPHHPHRSPQPLRILWAARWEFDKNPETFFEALDILQQRRVPFRLSVLGEQFRQVPEVFATARKTFADRIDRWGYQPERRDYQQALTESDVFVSTADHEFFGVSAVEAMASGCFPVLPNRLSYPELLAGVPDPERADFFYDGSAIELASKLEELASRLEAGDLWRGEAHRVQRAVSIFEWPELRPRLDRAIGNLPK